MKHHHIIPLATASLALTIARPAMAASIERSIVTQIEYVAPILAALGLGLLAINNFWGEHNFEERYQNINRIVKFLLSASIIGFLVIVLYYSLSTNP
jgi:hypothetical protein